MRKTPDVNLGAVNPVSKQPLQTHVYRDLRRLMMNGHLRPGQELKVRELALRFGTSVQPVREAILQLVAEKALEATPNASARVPVLDTVRLIDLRTVRLAVEGLAAELAAQHTSAADVDELAQIVALEAAADDAQDVEASVQRNREFHFRLYQMSGSALLPSIVEGLWLQVGPNIRDAAELFDARGGEGSAYHVDILNGLRKKDGKSVRRAVEKDIARFFDVLLSRHPASGQGLAETVGAVKGRKRPVASANKASSPPTSTDAVKPAVRKSLRRPK